MLLSAFTVFHVLLSVIGIGSGLAVLFGFLASKGLDRWTTLFLITTAATSATGFLFPFHRLLPSHVVGGLSLAILAVVFLARHRFQLSGR